MRLALLAMLILSAARSPAPAAPDGDEPRADAAPARRRLPLLARLEGGAERPITTPAEWHERRARILACMEEVMGKLPDPGSLPPLDPQAAEESRGAGLRRLRVSFAAGRGERVPAHLLLPEPPPAGRRPGILALHQTTSIGKGEPAGLGGLSNLHYGAELARRGYVVLCPDYPSFGDYRHDFSRDAHPSGTMQGIVGHRRAIDYLVSRPEVDPERIGAIGHSLGGHNAIFAAAFDERLKVTVSSSGWTPFADYKGGNLAGWSGDRYMPRIREVYGLDPARMPFELDETIACIAPRAFLSVSPLGDDNFSAAGVRKGIASAAGVYGLLGARESLKAIYPDCGHDFPLAARSEAYSFIDRALGHTPPPDAGLGAELPRVPPLEPDAALRAIVAAPGYSVELAAAEPLVTSPVALAFDEGGRLFVVEMNDYPERDAAPIGRVRLLDDADGDGRFEKSTVFADGLSWPTAVACWAGGAFVGAAPDILYMKDLDGDGAADERRVVFTGFGSANVQGLLNSFQWGLDNRIHGSASTCGGKVRKAGEPGAASLDLSGRCFSFDPRTLDLRAETGGGQHGLAFDDWGRKLICSNSDHIQLVLAEEGDLQGEHGAAPPPVASIALDGPQAEVFRRSAVEPWRLVRTRLRVAGLVPGPIEGGGRASGYFTSATGVTVYRGDAWPERDRGLAIVGDVGSNIVHRKALEPEGIGLAARRVDEGREFLASSDIWFRPVAFANAPDGTLLVADMCREVIEHPDSLPPEIKRHLDLSSGRDRGRIWRIVPEGFRRPKAPCPGRSTPEELALLLESGNGWVRDTAARLIFERRDARSIEPLRKVARESPVPAARIHALHALEGLGALEPGDLLRALEDAHPRVRERAAGLARGKTAAEALATGAPGVLRERLIALASDGDIRVRREAALGLGRLPAGDDAVEAVLLDVLRRDASEPWIRFAAASALGPASARALATLAGDGAFLRSAGAKPALEDLARAAGLGDEPGRAAAVEAIAGLPGGSFSRGVLRAFAASTARRAGVSQREALLGSPASAELLERFLDRAGRDALDAGLAAAERADAVRFLPLGPFHPRGESLVGLLDGREPQELQLAAASALGAFSEGAAADALLDAWEAMSPRVRAAACEALLSRSSRARAVLEKIEARGIRLDPARLRLLESHPDPEVRRRAASPALNRGPGERAAVMEAYRKAFELAGDPVRGRGVFRKSCAGCHAAGGEGHDVGPSIAAARSRGEEALLLAILDPTREMDPRFAVYAVVTRDGRTVTGIVASETASAVTLRRAEGEEDSIQRGEIQVMRSSGASLMPDGLEREIDPQSMADLLEWLRSLP